jgi:ubiquinone biosynthesis protein COQ4
MDASIPLPRGYDFVRAGRALAALLRDPDDLPQVFTIIDSMSGSAPYRLLRGFRRTAAGARLLRDRPDVGRLLADRASLRKLPAGSLGRAYLDFVESEGITAEGIREASEHSRANGGYVGGELEYLRNRMRDTHDLWHALTGYKGDLRGEVALLAFGLAQNWNSAIAVIVLAGILKGFGGGAAPLVIDGYRRGRAAAFLPPQDWESLLERPLQEVRAELGIGAPPVYEPLRTPEARAAGLI